MLMRRYLFLLSFLASISLFSTPTDNPAFPKVIQEGVIFSSGSYVFLSLGYEGDFVLDRRLEQKSSLKKRVNSFNEYRNSGALILNFLKRLDLFATVGQARYEANWIIEEEKLAYTNLELDTKSSLAWSAGTKIIFFEWNNFCFSMGGRYSYSDPRILNISKMGQLYKFDKQYLKYKEWQVDLGLSYKIDIFTPYICGKYSKAKASFSTPGLIISSDGDDHLSMESKDNIGMALGVTLSSGKYFMLNVEARLIDEEAFTVSGIFRF